MRHIDIYIDLVIDNAYAKRKRSRKKKVIKKKTTDPGNDQTPGSRRQLNDEKRKNDPRDRRDTKVHRTRKRIYLVTGECASMDALAIAYVN